MQYIDTLRIKQINNPKRRSNILYTYLTMYHTVYPSQMMVQIMGGHQTSGQCPPAQSHTLHINGVNALHQSDFPQYGPNISGHNRHRTIQVYVKSFRFNFKHVLHVLVCN